MESSDSPTDVVIGRYSLKWTSIFNFSNFQPMSQNASKNLVAQTNNASNKKWHFGANGIDKILKLKKINQILIKVNPTVFKTLPQNQPPTQTNNKYQYPTMGSDIMVKNHKIKKSLWGLLYYPPLKHMFVLKIWERKVPEKLKI